MIAAAIAATEGDLMLVPDLLSSAWGSLGAVREHHRSQS
jgi:hypothetical protein